jgi:hypothetical protein
MKEPSCAQSNGTKSNEKKGNPSKIVYGFLVHISYDFTMRDSCTTVFYFIICGAQYWVWLFYDSRFPK